MERALPLCASAIRTPVVEPVDLVLRARRNLGGRAGADAADRRAVLEQALPGFAADDPGLEGAGAGRQPQASATVDAEDGPGGVVARTEHQQAPSRAREISVLAPGRGSHPGQSGL